MDRNWKPIYWTQWCQTLSSFCDLMFGNNLYNELVDSQFKSSVMQILGYVNVILDKLLDKQLTNRWKGIT